MIEDRERAQIFSFHKSGLPSRANNARHQMDELQRALQIENNKDKYLLRQRKRLARQNKYLLMHKRETRLTSAEIVIQAPSTSTGASQGARAAVGQPARHRRDDNKATSETRT